METNSNQNPLISDTILISVLTAFGYIIAYCYESGFCGYFYIPSDLIEISITRVITVTLAMFGSLIVLGHFISPFLGLFSSESMVKRLIAKYIFFGMFFVIIWWSVDDISTMAFVFIGPGLELYFDLIHPLISKRKIVGYANKLEAFQAEFAEEKTRSIWFNDRIQRLLRREYAIMIVAGFTALLIASGLGRAQAKNQKYYLSAKTPNPILILRYYGSYYIGVNIDKNNILVNGIHVIERSNLKDHGPLMLQKLGPIKPNPAMKRTS